MNVYSRNQLIAALNSGDGFAITVFGVLLIDEQNDVANMKKGASLIELAAEGKNVLWAKNLWLYLRKFATWTLPIEEHALVDADAIEQLQIYSAKGNVWAMTILGWLCYQGKVTLQNRGEAVRLLNKAANEGCFWAKELMEEYGIVQQSASATDLLRKIADKNNPKYWLKS